MATLKKQRKFNRLVKVFQPFFCPAAPAKGRRAGTATVRICLHRPPTFRFDFPKEQETKNGRSGSLTRCCPRNCAAVRPFEKGRAHLCGGPIRARWEQGFSIPFMGSTEMQAAKRAGRIFFSVPGRAARESGGAREKGRAGPPLLNTKSDSRLGSQREKPRNMRAPSRQRGTPGFMQPFSPLASFRNIAGAIVFSACCRYILVIGMIPARGRPPRRTPVPAQPVLGRSPLMAKVYFGLLGQINID